MGWVDFLFEDFDSLGELVTRSTPHMRWVLLLFLMTLSTHVSSALRLGSRFALLAGGKCTSYRGGRQVAVALYSSSSPSGERGKDADKPSIAATNRLLMGTDRQRIMKKKAKSGGTTEVGKRSKNNKEMGEGGDVAEVAKNMNDKMSSTRSGGDTTKDRPFTLPPGQFKPKQSLGQNFLSDQNYVMKIVDSFSEDSDNGCRVVEVGPGPGALTRKLHERYPEMTAIELDQRAVAFLGEKLPGLNVLHQDVLTVDWPALAHEKGGVVSVIANLPYYIVSQVLFSFADSHKSINKAVVTMQLEVAERLVAKTRTKAYGIPSVVFQLYAKPVINFKIPPSVFFPRPKVDSALVTLDFTQPHPELQRVNGDRLRTVLLTSFQQRRKMLRSSLKELLKRDGLQLSAKWAEQRPEQLTPVDFVHLTIELYGEKEARTEAGSVDEDGTGSGKYRSQRVWRKLMEQ